MKSSDEISLDKKEHRNMKKIKSEEIKVEKVVQQVIETRDVVFEEEDGLESFLGKQVILFCLNYHYAGRLIGVNKTCVLLEGASVVFETGSFEAPKWKDAQKLGKDPHYVMISAIESFRLGK